MGFFDMFKKKKTVEKPQMTHEEKILAELGADDMPQFDMSAVDVKAVREQIAEILVYDDAEALEMIKKCIFNLAEYKVEYKADYENRGIDINTAEKDTLKWIGVVDCLIRCGYAVEVDHAATKDEFVGALQSVKSMTLQKLELTAKNTANLSDDGGVAGWCGEIDALWSEKLKCVGAIDIDSDSYVIFPISVAKLEELGNLANTIGHRITYAQIM